MKSPNSEDPHYTVLPMLMFPLSHRSMYFPQFVSLKHPYIWSRNWGSIVCIVTRQQAEQQELWCNFWQGWGIFLFS